MSTTGMRSWASISCRGALGAGAAEWLAVLLVCLCMYLSYASDSSFADGLRPSRRWVRKVANMNTILPEMLWPVTLPVWW